METQSQTPKVAPSPVDALAGQFRNALVELGKLEAQHNAMLSKWAKAKKAAEAAPTSIVAAREFERQTALLREVNSRFVAAQRRVRELDVRTGTAHARWSLSRQLGLSGGANV